MTDRDLSDHNTAAFWDDRYASSTRLWSGEPNVRLVEHVADLTPGTAIDAGCGEGADVVWLAQQGWQVTGVDVSQVALDRAEAHAEEAGVSDRTAFRAIDVLAGEPLPGPVDLVVSHYLHAPTDAFATGIAELAAAVAPGGTLLVVGHHPDDEHTGLRNPELTALLFTPEQVTDLLGEEWSVERAEKQTRTTAHGTGDHAHVAEVTDTVVLAVRRPHA